MISRLKIKQLPRRFVRLTNFALLAFILAPLAATERLPAGFSSKVVRVTVEIDGINFGAFEPIQSILSDSDAGEGSGKMSKISLSRHFVTDQSLYKWADEAMRGQAHLRDLTLISENAEGVEVARHLLKNSQPVSAVVEASNPGVGGLHEKVEFAVQSVQRL
jgi:hypothetical protein